MRRLALLATTTVAILGVTAPAAGAAFGLNSVQVVFTESDGLPATRAGSHPFAMTTSFRLNTVPQGDHVAVEGALRDLDIEQPPGLVGDRTAVPTCSTVNFLNRIVVDNRFLVECADSSAVGVVRAALCPLGRCSDELGEPTPVYNLEPSPGVPAKVGFWAGDVPVVVELVVSEEPPYSVVGRIRNVSQAAEMDIAEFTLWGSPADEAHDPERGACLRIGGSCSAGVPVRPFLTLPRRCADPLVTRFRAIAWWPAGAGFAADVGTSPGTTDCESLGFAPTVSAQPTTDRVASPTGLEFQLLLNDEGIGSSTGTAQSDVKKAVVTLPPGLTANPSLAEGLATCSPADVARESADSAPGEGCPEAAKIGALEVESPILPGEIVHGELYVATPDDPTTHLPGAENPFDSLLALYMVVKDAELGIAFELPGKVEPDPGTGRLTTTFDDLPQFPVSRFRLRFREGGRSPLITPSTCGAYTTVARLTPWARPGQAVERTSELRISAGLDGGPCPAGSPPFAPGFTAGTLSNQAGSYSPFYMRLSRRDGDQDITRFASSLPPGLLANLSGVEECPAAAIEQAKARTGRAELASPSCPAESAIGRLEVGAGVGSQLTYVPGRLYLSGPYNDAPLSVVAIVPAVAGPFDVGTVAVRMALRVDPRSGEVTVDGAASDPLPHILAGIPLNLRDVRVHVDRSRFTFNPTSCDPFAIGATVWGGGADPFGSVDDVPTTLSDRFQAANCARLRFRPRLSMRLRGGTKRGDHPALQAIYRPRRGDANLKGAVVRLPGSAFLDQAHIRTICTRIQFRADDCPRGARYGRARVTTPLLSRPLAGPVYLRSSNNTLPDLVADLHGRIDIEAVARLDSKDGGIRATFTNVPDAPLAKVVIRMPGGRRGLVVNSRDLCVAPARATARFTAHNGRRRTLHAVVGADCVEPRAR